MEVGLVSCTKSKRDEPCQPGELYMASALFRKARAYCENVHDAWYILSAEHGVLDPDGPTIAPYDKTLVNASIRERQEWSRAVYNQLEEKNVLDGVVVFHAGKAYTEELIPLLDQTSVSYRQPLNGLKLGERLQWYNANL